MEISGKALQHELLKNLEARIKNLELKGTTPGIAIVTLGPEETWEAYVGQKIKLAKKLGIEAKLVKLKPQTTEDVLSVIEELNEDPSIHGLIVQRPFPIHIDTERVIQKVSKYKDIDGFRNDSLYEVPVWMAVHFILTRISQLLKKSDLQEWLSNQSIVVVGKGQTAGLPIINGFKKMEIRTSIIDSKTQDRDELFRSADVILFAAGNSIDVPYKSLKKNSVLIGIGLHRNNGKLEGDFDENEASGNVLYYTPSPGGVGPLNLYFLFENLVKGAEQQKFPTS